jgi:hypothetical protein
LLSFIVADVCSISPQQPQSENSSAFLTHFDHQVNGARSGCIAALIPHRITLRLCLQKEV